jgi:hypothetical protein
MARNCIPVSLSVSRCRRPGTDVKRAGDPGAHSLWRERWHHVSVQSVQAVVEAQFERWAGTGAGSVDRDVLGTDQPIEIAEIFERFCIERLGASPVGGLFYAASAGCVLGVHLDSGADVVVKAYQSRWSQSFLAAVQDGEERVAAGGIPCPRPLAAPTPLREGRPNLAVVETWLPDPGLRPGGTAAARGVSARGLARQVALCVGLPGSDRLLSHPLGSPDTRLYPEPHSPLFDFDSTAVGAEWIDELAHRASLLRAQDERAPIVAHTDWSARNVRFDEDRLLAVYDWDSLALVPESAALGQAAMTWSVTADPGGTEFPTLDSVLAYMEDYEAEREGPLTTRQRRAARASAVWVLAYTSRCEHSLAVRGLAREDQSTARERLAEVGAELLNP